MTVAWVSGGTVGVGSTSVTPGLPASLATGDGVLIQVVTKPDTATINTPAGWTLVANIAGGGGTTGNGVGPTRQAWFFREKDAGWSTMPAISITSGNSSAAVASRYTKAAGTAWDVLGATGTFNTAGAATATDSQVVAPTGGYAIGDFLVVGQSAMDEAPTWSSQAVTNLSAVAIAGTVTERNEAVETTTGNDIGGHYFTAVVTTAVSAGVTILARAVASVATRGTTVITRLREAVAAPADLTVTPVSSTQLNVSWSSVSGATDYNLERSLDGSSGWTRVNGGAPQTGTSYNDTGRSAATMYYYRVSATTASGTSAPSATVSNKTWVVPPFTETFTSGFVSGSWGQDWTLSAASPSTVAGSFALQSNMGTISPDSTGAARSLLDVETQTDQGVYFEATLLAGTALKVVLRAANGWSAGLPVDGYVASFGTADANTITKLVASSSTALSPTGDTWGTPAAGVAHKFRFEVVGTTLRTRAWTGTEPSTWRTVTDASLASGILGFAIANAAAGAADLDNVEYYIPSGGAAPARLRNIQQQTRPALIRAHTR